MNSSSAHGPSLMRTAKREVRDVPEKKRVDNSIDRIITVRKQRLDRLERECIEARAAWRGTRQKLRDMREAARIAKEEANEYWQQARAAFLKMTITSGQFRVAKSTYDRMKAHAAQLLLECREAVTPCKQGKVTFFEAKRAVTEARLKKEKLSIMRDTIRSEQLQEEA